MKLYTLNQVGKAALLTAAQLQVFVNSLDGILRESAAGNIALNFRGNNTDWLNKQLFHDSEADNETVLSRLFYFGEKARDFLNSPESGQRDNASAELKKLANDCFNKLKALSKRPKEPIRSFVQTNEAFFAYFSEAKNKHIFCATISELGPIVLDYYCQILHTAGKRGIHKHSRHVSASESLMTALQFSHSGCGSRVLIVCINRLQKYRNEARVIASKHGLPVMPEHQVIYPKQCEYSYRAAIFPHNIFVCLVQSSNGHYDVYVTPHLFSLANRDLDISKGSLQIDQSNFQSDLKKTCYRQWVETVDYRFFKYRT
jgi:hypothetical protein